MLRLFMVFVKETLKFLMLSFFKQCRIILKILDKFHEMRRDRDDHRSQNETKESILADMLARNLKWAILTILTCIPEEREDYGLQIAQQHAANTGINVMSDLVCFRPILQALQTQLHKLVSYK